MKRSIPNGVTVRNYNSILHALKSILFEKNEFSNVDIVNIHGYRTPFSTVLGIGYKAIRHPPLVFTLHGIIPSFSFYDACKKRIYDKTLGMRALQYSDAIITYKVTEEQLLKLAPNPEIARKKTYFIPNSVDLDNFKNLPSPLLFRKTYSLPNKNIVLFVGRLVPLKGIEFLIRALPEVTKTLRDVLLVIVGQGKHSYVKYLQQIAVKLGVKDSVIFVGEIVNEKLMYSAYAASTVLVLPTRYDVLPTVLLEALASGLPIITTRIKGTSVIKDEVTGLLVDYGDVKQLAKAIVRALEDQNLRKRISSHGKEIVQKRYNWRKNSLLVEAIYQKVIQ
jgi:glycosyltransferase involved in cell wall biosynthesis